MKNRDRRFDHYMNDSRFNHIVSVMESMLYSDSGITYQELLDAAFVAQVRFIERNPSATMVLLKEEGLKD